MDAPLRLIAPEPTVLVPSVPLVHEVVPAVEMVIPVGNVSVTPTPVRVTPEAFGLVIVMVIVDVPPTVILVGEKALVIVGGRTGVRTAAVSA